MKNIIHKLYDWLLEKSRSPQAFWYLGIISFTESSISFIPPDPIMIPMIVAEKRRAWTLALWTTATSVAGGFLGYAIGFYLFERLGIPILEAYGLTKHLDTFQSFFHEWGFWAIVIKALTPIPFKLVTITAGALKFNIWSFFLASTLSRGVRFFVEAALLWKFGEQINRIIQKHMMILGGLFVALLVGGFIAVRYLF